MAKFEIELELTGLKVRVRGERSEDMPHLTGQIGRQLAGLMQPAAAMIDESAPKQVEATVRDTGTEVDRSKGNGRARNSRRKPGTNGDAAPKPLVWQHDPGKWGMPKQSWAGWQKILWLQYVIGKETAQTEVSGPIIAETFNTLFKQFGLLSKQNMPREMGGLKKRSPALVLDNPTHTPITWFLTDEGSKEAERLVAEAKTGGSSQPEA